VNDREVPAVLDREFPTLVREFHSQWERAVRLDREPDLASRVRRLGHERPRVAVEAVALTPAATGTVLAVDPGVAAVPQLVASAVERR
jgi:hypothetical protein